LTENNREQELEDRDVPVDAENIGDQQFEELREVAAEEKEATAEEEKADAPEDEELSELQELRDVCAKQQALIEKIFAPPLVAVTIVDVTENGTAIVSYDNGFHEVTMDPALTEMVFPGVQVFMDGDSKTITKLSTKPYTAGQASTVERILEHGYAEVDVSGKLAKVVNPINAEEGDSVALNVDATVIIDRLPKDKNKFKLGALSDMTWNDIGGLDEAKADIIRALDHPFRYPDLYQKYGRKPVKGGLLFGPPGCGKTMIARVAANMLAQIHGADSVQTGYIYVKGPEVLSPWVGRAEATIRQLFLQARAHKEKHGYPAVIFIDEAESILSKRGTGISSDMEKTIVPMFLSEMDGLDQSGAFVLLATNRADVLDPAVIRDGRIDVKIKIGRPNEVATLEIFKIHMADTPRQSESLDELAKYATERLFSNDQAIVKFRLKKKEDDKPICKLFKLANLVNGAMIAGIVQNAISNALDRDIGRGTFSGVSQEDIDASIAKTLKQMRGVSFRDDLREFIKPFKNDIDKQEVVK